MLQEKHLTLLRNLVNSDKHWCLLSKRKTCCSAQTILTTRIGTDGSTTASCNTGDQIYCGGTWQGIIKKLDYIQGMGFTAIWISPIVKNIDGNSNDGSSYHGYWAQDINSLNQNFGTEADLIALSKALHDRGMYLMVDIVTNHMANIGCGNCVDYSKLLPFNQARSSSLAL